MSYAPRRAALLSLCVLAILLAASLFPATGFGPAPSVTAPAPDLPDEGDDGDGPAGTTAGPTPSDPSPTTASQTTAATTERSTSTATATTTTTTAAAPTTDPPNGDDGTPSWAFLVVFVILGGAVPIGLYSMGYRRRGWWLEASAADGDFPDLPPPRVRAAIQSIPQTTMGIVLGLAFSVPDLLSGFGTVLRETADGTAMALDGFAQAFGRLAVGLPRAFASGLGAFGSGLGAALGGLPSVFVSLGGGLGDRNWPSFGSRSADGDGDSARAGADEDEPRPPPRTVQEAWARMTEYVVVPNRRAATPTDYARTAIERGYPAGAVERLTELFVEVRYGGRPADERTEAAVDAFEQFRQHADGGDDP